MDVRGGERLGPVAEETARQLERLADLRGVERAFAGDHGLWQDDPTEVADRLGWLRAPVEMRAELEGLRRFAHAAVADGITDVVVCGMGGSSLFPEVLARTVGAPAPPGAARLHVLDTTDPAAVLRLDRTLDTRRTLWVVSSKSGTTVETRSHLEHAWDRVRDGRFFVAVTDPGTELAALARERGFRAVFEAASDVGGRYSALTHFGLVPGALAGADVAALLDRGELALREVAPATALEANPAARLAAYMAAGVAAGRDKLTVVSGGPASSFGPWIEQLVAESTGKAGTGLLPVVDEAPGEPAVYGDDRLFVAVGGGQPWLDELAAAGHPVVVLPLSAPADLGWAVVVWELATALCGALLRVNPFDQPDVAAAKEATDRALRDGLVDEEPASLATATAALAPGDYLAIQAYVDPAGDVVGALEAAREVLRDRYRVAVTLGLGPRYLHSTGQYHKGGPPTGVFVQVVGDDPEDAGIPGRPHGFARLKRAQADGDLAALRAGGARAWRVALGELVGLAG